MDLSDIKKVVQRGESETVEFKKSLGQIKRTIKDPLSHLNIERLNRRIRYLLAEADCSSLEEEITERALAT